jgi:hypothetical protein
MQRLLRLLTSTGATKSLRGHMVFFQVVWSLPMFALVSAWDYRDGTLTAAQLVRDVVVSAVGGVFMAFVCWHVVTLPILKRTGRKP